MQKPTAGRGLERYKMEPQKLISWRCPTCGHCQRAARGTDEVLLCDSCGAANQTIIYSCQIDDPWPVTGIDADTGDLMLDPEWCDDFIKKTGVPGDEIADDTVLQFLVTWYEARRELHVGPPCEIFEKFLSKIL